jgi:bifunctional ADP-heptose synthase (sugar kinase/adenylyltransferase)
MFTTEARRLESLIQRVLRLDQENDLKRQKEQPYQRLRELEQHLSKQEVVA